MTISVNPTNTPFNWAQTFFIDPARVGGADVIHATSIELYFKALPSPENSRALYPDPGVSVFLCPVENNVPLLSQYYWGSGSYKKRSQLSASTTSLVSNKFEFSLPVPLKPGQKYAVLLSFDGDEAFYPWTAIAGDVDLVKGTRVSLDSGFLDGNLFQITNGRVLTPVTNTDLTFKLNIARFTDLDVDYRIVNDDYEFLTVNAASSSGTLLGGEGVYKQTSALGGTVNITKGGYTITGNSTSFVSNFKVGDKIVVESASLKSILTVNSISSNTVLTTIEPIPLTNTVAVHKATPTGQIYDYEPLNSTLILARSTAANSGFRFANGDVVVGADSGATITIVTVDDATAMRYTPAHTIIKPGKTEVTISPTFANSSYNLDDNNTFTVENGKQKYIDTYHAILASRSNEVINTTNLMANTAKSVKETLNLTSTSNYVSPSIPALGLGFTLTSPDINNDSTNEHTSQGNARSKYVSRKFALNPEQAAEDMRVYLTAYRPYGTNVEVYVKFHNHIDPEEFEGKDWTKMELVSIAQNTQYSDPTNRGDTINLEFAIPSYHSGNTATGQFTTTSACNVITGTSGVVNTEITANSIVRVYNPIIPENFFITRVSSANSTAFVIDGDSQYTTTVSNSSLVGVGMQVDVVNTYAYSAFVDNQNYNIVRYYNKQKSVFSTYSTFAVKIVLLSDSQYKAPVIYDMRALALSA